MYKENRMKKTNTTTRREEYINEYYIAPGVLKCLKTGKLIRFDPSQEAKVLKYRWAVLEKNSGNHSLEYAYARGLTRGEAPDFNLALHRYLTDAPKGKVVDHINHNTLDNRSENLRVCTQAENLLNRKKNKNNTCGIKGVSVNGTNNTNPFRAQFKGKYIGSYKTIEEAAAGYNDFVADIAFAAQNELGAA